FLSFAFRVARNAWIDRRRRAAHRPAEASGGDDAETVFDRTAGAFEAPYERAETREESQLVQAAVGALPEGHRLVFELGVVEERPYAEISEILDIPVGTVKSRMHNAVRKVRAALEGGAEA
ncbi:MAG: sigma-70 family RNA polymerase sigma factor, partial [Planctomycetota bacterium]